jgi:hypothetical protein
MDFRPRIIWSLALPLFAIFLALSCDAAVSLASSGTIDATNHYAWNDNGGYVNWKATGSNVTVTDTALTGYIWSAGFGWINLSPTLGGVTNSNGTLGGYAWGANTGWINFAGVTIDSNGRFHGQTTAQSLFGTMTFDCTYCNVTTAWRGSTIAPTNTTNANTGGGGVVGGPLSVGYQNGSGTSGTATPSSSSAASGSSVNTNPPKSLVPTSPPPASKQPSKGPTSSATTPAQLTPSITLSISTSPTATVGNPIALNIAFSDSKRSQPIAYAYRLYRADSSIAYSNTGTLAVTDASSLSASIPTTGLAVGSYKVAVSAQYGKQSIVSQTLPIALYASKDEASSHVLDTGITPTEPTPESCSWLTCWWQAAVTFFKRLF